MHLFFTCRFFAEGSDGMFSRKWQPGNLVGVGRCDDAMRTLWTDRINWKTALRHHSLQKLKLEIRKLQIFAYPPCNYTLKKRMNEVLFLISEIYFDHLSNVQTLIVIVRKKTWFGRTFLVLLNTFITLWGVDQVLHRKFEHLLNRYGNIRQSNVQNMLI